MAAPKGPRGPQTQEATFYVKRTLPSGAEQEDQGPLEVTAFQSTPAQVSAKAGRTINLGNFESFKIEVGLTYPCYPEEVEDAMAVVAEKVGAFLKEEVDDIKAAAEAGVL